MASTRNTIKLVAAPTAGDPPDVSLVVDPAHVRFAGSTKVVRDATPFLAWKTSGTRKSPSADLPLHLFEALLLPLLTFEEEAADCLFLTHAISPEFLRRAFLQLLTDGFKLQEYTSYQDFLADAQRARAATQVAARFVVSIGDLWQLEPADTDPGELQWLAVTCWKHWLPDSATDMAITAFFVSLFGARAHARSRESPDGRFKLLCSQFQASFIKFNDSVALPAAFAGPLIAGWLIAVPWPQELLALVTSDQMAFQEMRIVLVSSAGTALQRSSLLRKYLSRALPNLPGLASFLDGSVKASDTDLLLPLLQRLKLESGHPSWPDLMALEEALLVRMDLCDSVPAASHAPQLRLTLLLEDFAAEQRTLNLKPQANVSGAGDQDALLMLSAIPADHSSSLNLLRRSKGLLDLVARLLLLESQGALTRSVVLKLAFESRISAVVRFMTGVLTSLDLHPVFANLSAVRLTKFKKDAQALSPLGLYLGQAVIESVRSVLPESHHRLSDFSLHHTTVFNLLMGNWQLIDFEQVLVINVSLARGGKPQKADSRKKEVWFTNESTLSDLVAPMTALLAALGYSSDPAAANSFAAIASEVVKAFRLARMNDDCAASVPIKAVEAMHKAMADSAQGWALYFLDTSPCACFPPSVLPESSNCFQRLQSAMKTSNMMVDLVADGLEDILENILARKRGLAPTPTPPLVSKKPKPSLPLALPAPLGAYSSSPPNPPPGLPPPGLVAKHKAYYNVDEKEDLIQLSKSTYALSKVKAHFGGVDKCWAVCVTNKPNREEACPYQGEADHKPGDPLHSFSTAKLKHFQEHRNDFVTNRVFTPWRQGNGRP
jgi:hypothetical protein